jgi:hypothetical protein
VPNLPADPVLAGGGSMEGMFVLAGVNTPGYGFVPLGMGAGLDCTAEVGCLDRAANPTLFDGVIDGAKVCEYDDDPEDNRCAPHVLAVADGGVVDDGRIGFYSAAPHSGLEGGDVMLIGIALPLSSVGSTDFRATAFIKRNTPPQEGASNQLQNETYPSMPEIDPAFRAGSRVYQPAQHADHRIHWVTFAKDTTDSSIRWNVYFAGSPGQFHAPAVPDASFPDPFAPADCEGSPCVNVTHLGFRTGTTELADLAVNQGASLSNLVDHTTGFAAISSDVPAP